MSRYLTLSEKEIEAVLWGVAQMSDYPDREIGGPTDPLHVLSREGYKQQDVVAACIEIEELLSDSTFLVLPLDPIECAILRQCVETTTWLDAYLQPPVNHDGRKEAHAALVTFAAKLDEIGTIVNFIPDL